MNKKNINYIQLLEKTIILSFISYDLYKLHIPSLQKFYKNLNNIDKKFHNLVKKLEKKNLYLMGLESAEELEKLSPELIEFGKHLIIKRIANQKVFMEKLSFMVDLITKGDTTRIRKFQVLKFMRFCIEVSILSLNIYNKSVFVTKMEESSLKLKSIMINKPMLFKMEFPFVIVYDSKSLNMILCVAQSLKEIKKLHENSFNKEIRAQLSPHDLLQPKDKSISQDKLYSKKSLNRLEFKKQERVDPFKKKRQVLKVLGMQKEKLFFSMNKMCEGFDKQTEILKMFLVKKIKSDNVSFIKFLIFRHPREII